MYGSMRSDRFPYLHDYAAALRKYEEIKPFVKGAFKGERPLAERTRPQLRILKDDVDAVIVRLYNTDIIRFKPDGQIELDQGGWATATTHEVMGRVLGTSLFIRGGKGWIVCQNGTYPLGERPNVLRRGSVSDPNHYGTGLHFLNPEYPSVRKVNRKNLTIVRRRYSEFTKYAMRMVKLLGQDCVHNDDLCRSHGVHLYTDQAICDAMLDEDKRYEAWLALLKATHYQVTKKRYSYSRWDEARVLTAAEIRSTMTKLFYSAHHNEVLDIEVVRDGRVVVDRYKEYPR